MLRSIAFWILIGLTLMAGAARAQAPKAPLQLVPSEASAPARLKVPNNWKIVDNGRDPLTEKPSRIAIALPKSDSSQNGKSAIIALILLCLYDSAHETTHPAVALVLTSSAGAGRYKKFSIRYRFDEESVRSNVVVSDIGKGEARRILLPVSEYEDPIKDIAAAKRFRAEVDLRTKGVVYLDSNVTGAAEAAKAIGCQ